MDKKSNKSKNVIMAEVGLLKDSVWEPALLNYPTGLICSIRKRLLSKIPGITEKFNKRSRYFGYWTGTDKDRVYIHVQKKGLRIDLCIDRKFETDLRKAGFEVKFVNSFQGRADWLTGWHVTESADHESDRRGVYGASVYRDRPDGRVFEAYVWSHCQPEAGSQTDA